MSTRTSPTSEPKRGLDRRTLLLGAALGPLAAALTACGGQDADPQAVEDRERALTAEEAELLALVRFRFHQERTVPVTLTWPGADASTVEATLDLANGAAWGRARWEDDVTAERLIAWDPIAVATAPVPEDGGAAPGLAEWSTRALTTDVVQDIFFGLALSLGTDRPENPVLIRQSSARFLRADEVDGVQVSVFSGPRPAGEEAGANESRTRYWIDADGVLQRFEAYLGDRDGEFAVLTRADRAPDVPELAARAGEVLRIAGGARR